MILMAINISVKQMQIPPTLHRPHVAGSLRLALGMTSVENELIFSVPPCLRGEKRFSKADESKTKRPPGKRRPFLSRENSSNGGKTVKTF